jgi:hypothetical protein
VGFDEVLWDFKGFQGIWWGLMWFNWI